MRTILRQGSREIAFHSPHLSLGKYLIFFLFLDMVWIVLLIGFLVVASGFPFVQPSPDPLVMIAVQIFMLILCIPALFLVVYLSSFALFTMRRLNSHKPVLLVTSEGLSFQDLLMTGTFFLSWNEVASFSMLVPASKYSRVAKELCLGPKDCAQFLSRYHPLWRFVVRVNSLATGNLIRIPQWFLSTPVEDVLSQIQETFQKELITYEVSIPDTHSKEDLS